MSQPYLPKSNANFKSLKLSFLSTYVRVGFWIYVSFYLRRREGANVVFCGSKLKY